MLVAAKIVLAIRTFANIGKLKMLKLNCCIVKLLVEKLNQLNAIDNNSSFYPFGNIT